MYYLYYIILRIMYFRYYVFRHPGYALAVGAARPRGASMRHGIMPRSRAWTSSAELSCVCVKSATVCGRYAFSLVIVQRFAHMTVSIWAVTHFSNGRFVVCWGRGGV